MDKIICKILTGKMLDMTVYTGYITVYTPKGKYLYSTFGDNITRTTKEDALKDAQNIKADLLSHVT
jgi:hypothetical protein